MTIILPFLWDISKYNLPMLAIFFALLIGLWAVETNLLEALSGTTGNGSITAGTWSFVIFWIFYFALAVWKARERQLESAKKAEIEMNETHKAQKKLDDDNAFKDHLKMQERMANYNRSEALISTSRFGANSYFLTFEWRKALCID